MSRYGCRLLVVAIVLVSTLIGSSGSALADHGTGKGTVGPAGGLTPPFTGGGATAVNGAAYLDENVGDFVIGWSETECRRLIKEAAEE